MAARIIAQLVVNTTAILGKAFHSAYQQALRNAKAGGAPGGSATITSTKYKMRPDEAMQILNIEKSEATPQLVLEQYKKYFDANDPTKGGSFYLQSKFYRSKEVLENEYFAVKPKESEVGSTEGDNSATAKGFDAEPTDQTKTR